MEFDQIFFMPLAKQYMDMKFSLRISPAGVYNCNILKEYPWAGRDGTEQSLK